MARKPVSTIEALESRIAPANLTVTNPPPNIVAGPGKTGATIDLGNLFNPSATAFDTVVDFTTNFIDPTTGKPGHIVIDLFDSETPLTVQNFLNYVESGAYTNTFFHRLVSGFVLQGGGYKATNPNAHIPTGPEVHNEYNPNNPDYSNVTGTVAMAKLGIGPDTANSEFFFNLGDNSQNLNNQNGGFTVFGKLTQSSLTFVEDIAKLPTAQINNGALSSVPYQGSHSPKSVTPSDVIRITNAKVTSPLSYNAPGVTFKVDSITDAGTNNATDLVSAKMKGETLQLKYKPGASGVANITVEADQNGQALTETFSVTVKPNLIIDSAGARILANRRGLQRIYFNETHQQRRRVCLGTGRHQVLCRY